MNRRTRFVCVSDTHNMSPADGAFKLPAGDVLIHAGDLTKTGTQAELRRALTWIEAADFEEKIVVAGNHDLTLDREFYEQYGRYKHNQDPQDVDACRALVGEFPSIRFLEHAAAEVRLERASGPRTRFRVFGSPLSPRKREWAFQYGEDQAAALWAQVPLHADVVVTHTPPKFHCDEWDGREGCEALRQAMWRVRPRLLVCGHIHSARGAERVRWDLGQPNVRYKELNVGYWQDGSAGSKRQALLDLSARGGEPLDNDGGHPGGAGADVDMAGADAGPAEAEEEEESATRGRGGSPPSGRSDGEALLGRLGRRETCVVNASIMGTSWPYRGSGGDRYNKPIVVDIDLPVWG